jgi:hypothetical protein
MARCGGGGAAALVPSCQQCHAAGNEWHSSQKSYTCSRVAPAPRASASTRLSSLARDSASLSSSGGKGGRRVMKLKASAGA